MTGKEPFGALNLLNKTESVRFSPNWPKISRNSTILTRNRENLEKVRKFGAQFAEERQFGARVIDYAPDLLRVA